MKKVLILGVGNAQTDFIKYCRKSGFIVHTCSYKNEGRGIKESDQFHLVNITDVEGVKDIIRKNQIDVVYSVGSDLAMPTIAQVAKEMDMAGFIGTETAIICNHKPKLRDRLSHLKKGVYSITHALLSSEQDLLKWNTYPAIVKPARSQGQRGIQKVHNEVELKRAFVKAANISYDQKAIVEEYVDGFEISVNSYIKDGQPLFYFVTERISFQEYPGGIIKSHQFPVSKTYNETKLKELVDDTSRYLQIHQGPVYFQVKINSRGMPKLIEVTPRLDGCHLWRLLKMLDGPDLFHTLHKQLSGQAIQPGSMHFPGSANNKKAELFFFTQPPGTCMDRDAFKTAKKPDYLEWYYEDGEIIREINGYQEKVGYQIIIEK